MPVTKTAKRALRGSKRKELINKEIKKNLEIAIRRAIKSKKPELVRKAISWADISVKNNLIHKNKASRIKSRLSKLIKDLSIKKSTSVKTKKSPKK